MTGEDRTQVVELLNRRSGFLKKFCADDHYGVPLVYCEPKRRGIAALVPRGVFFGANRPASDVTTIVATTGEQVSNGDF